jgi:peptidoglycan/LPS O-acetylase OafA/YrhL
MSVLGGRTAAGTPRRADIQGLRALAVLLVVAFHAGLPVPGGFMGVDVFFAISGFVITTMLLAELESSGRIDFPRFYIRRARRLLPALALMLSVVLTLGALLSPAVTQHMTALTGMAASVFAANAYLLNLDTGYFDANTGLNPLLHTWTLAVEEQFYIVFPALLLLGWWVGRRRSGANARIGSFVLVGAASVGSLVLFLELSAGWANLGPAAPERFAFYSSLTRAWEFGAGALLALATPFLARLSARTARCLGATGLLAIALAAFSGRGVWIPGTAAFLPVLGTCSLIAAGSFPGLVSRALGIRPVVWIGDLSYSWYLWHWPLIVFAAALWPGAPYAKTAAAALSLVPSWLSFKYVENHIRTGVHLGGRAFAVVATACVLVPIAAGVGLLGVQSALAARSPMGSWLESRALHLDVKRGCDSPQPLSERSSTACVWQAIPSEGRIVLVGDSNAGHFTEPVVAAARQAHLDLTVATFSSCPFVEVGVVRAEALEGEAVCTAFTHGTLSALVEMKPNLVITAARTDRYIAEDSIRLRDATGKLTRSPREKARLWEEGLRRLLAQLQAADIPVLVAEPVPMFPRAPDECTTLAILRNGCSSFISRASVEAELEPAREVERRAVASVSNAALIDFEDEICNARRCETSRSGTILYRDADHLSVDGALTLTDRFYRAIEALAR